MKLFPAAAEVRLPAGACVVFEDAEAGVTAARRADCRVVGIGGRRPPSGSKTASWIRSNGTRSVPKHSMNRPTGLALPIA